MDRLKGLLIDAEQVYFQYDGNRFFDAMHDRYGVSADAVRAVYKRSSQIKRYKRGLMTGQEFWRFACRELGISATPADIIDLMVQGYSEDEGLISIMDDMRQADIKFVMCTNNIRERMDVLEERFGFRKRFDAVITSYETHLLKPSATIFKEAAQAVGLAPRVILGIDDQVKNARRMYRMGFQTHLYAGSGRLRKDLEMNHSYLFTCELVADEDSQFRNSF